MTKLTHGDVEKTQQSKQKFGDENQLFEQIAIEETPFHAVKMGDQWFLTLGKYRLSTPMQTLAECQEDAKDTSWIRLMQIMRIMVSEHELIKSLQTAVNLGAKENEELLADIQRGKFKKNN